MYIYCRLKANFNTQSIVFYLLYKYAVMVSYDQQLYLPQIFLRTTKFPSGENRQKRLSYN